MTERFGGGGVCCCSDPLVLREQLKEEEEEEEGEEELVLFNVSDLFCPWTVTAESCQWHWLFGRCSRRPVGAPQGASQSQNRIDPLLNSCTNSFG